MVFTTSRVGERMPFWRTASLASSTENGLDGLMRQALEEARDRAPALVLLVIAAFLAISVLTGDHGLAGILALQDELSEAKQINFRLVQKIARIKEEIEAIRTDDGRLEQIARRQALLVRPDETIYLLPRPASPGRPATATPD